MADVPMPMDIIAKDCQPSHKFTDPITTATGEPRASVELRALNTLWFNTGTLCNLACTSCYIESSPSNDALVYLSRAEVNAYLDEITNSQLPVKEIGITGGEPFMNPDILGILQDCLLAGHKVLVLTNAMRPMEKCAPGLLELQQEFASQLHVRVSVDHFTPAQHELERGKRSWDAMQRGIKWLAEQGFDLSIAGRTRWLESATVLRKGYADLFSRWSLNLDAQDPQALLLFPEMDPTADVPEITTSCWATLDVDPAQMMCATSRMVVKHKGAAHPTVVACTLLPHATDFAFAQDLGSSLQPVALNHQHCATFCVLGGASCSG